LSDAWNDLPDEELVERARNAPEGDLRPFEALVERYKSRVNANCRYLSKSPSDTDDLAQEVFLKVFFGLAGFEGRAKFRTWVYRIKANHCMNYLDKKAGKTFVDVADPALEGAEELHHAPRAERNVAARDDRERIVEVLETMHDTLRVPLILRDMDQMAYQEIADTIGIGLSAVKMRIKRAREEFQRRFAEDTTEVEATATE
jgi:RNA polymerase sigma-70 factor (ECF subfamily)